MANKNKKIIHNLYLISNKYNKLYSDDKWETVYELFNDLKKSNGIIDGTLSGGVYKNYFSNSEIPSRIYNVVFETEYGTNIIGTITCSAAGTFEEPFYPYDIYCNFSEETLNESKNVDFAKKHKFKMNGETLDGYCHVIDEENKLNDTNNNMKKKTLKESDLRKIIRSVLMESFNDYDGYMDKYDQMDSDWEDLEDEYSQVYDKEDAFDSPIASRNTYDEKGRNAMNAMDRSSSKEYRDKHYISNNMLGKSARGVKDDYDLNHTFDDEIDNLGLNIEKDYPNGHEDFNKKWDQINETIDELSNQTIGSYLHGTKNQRRERQFENGKSHALYTINKRYSFGYKLDDNGGAIFKLDYDYKTGKFLISVDSCHNISGHYESKTFKLDPSMPTQTIDGTSISDSFIEYLIDNFRAGERKKFKLLCQSANELNSQLSDEQANS